MVSEMLEPPELGPRLRDRRQAKGLTLEGLATASGVSRSMLSQVERGEANPTFATLWSLTQALGLSLDDLVATEPTIEAAPVEVLARSATPRLDGDDSGAVLWLLAPADRVGDVEWYELCLAPGARLTSQPHAAGTHEHVTVLDGTVAVTADGHTAAVETGGTARYGADIAHEIANPHDEAARGLLVVLGSET